MWIRSQDEEILVEVTEFSTIKVFGSDSKKACIMGKIINTSDEIPLGFYKSMEDAKKELLNIEHHLSKRLINIYQIN